MIIGNTDHVFSFPVQKSVELFGITVDDRLCLMNTSLTYVKR